MKTYQLDIDDKIFPEFKRLLKKELLNWIEARV